MEYPKGRIRWILPTLATIAFVFLLMHESEFPVVFKRYSINYTILLILAAINLGLSWRLSVLCVSYRQAIKRFSARHLVSVAILVLSVVLLFDFMWLTSPSDWVILALLIGILIQAGLRRESDLVSSHLALSAGSLVLSLILIELIFVLFLLQARTPTSEREFLQLMSSEWPHPISVAKPAGTFRILGLSDSFGTAGGTSSNFHYLLEVLLRRDVSRSIEMVNVSLSGYDLLEELAILRFGMAYSPDLVLHGFYVGNDFSVEARDTYAYRNIRVRRDRASFRYRPGNFLSRTWIANAVKFMEEERRRENELSLGKVDRTGLWSRSTFFKSQLRVMNTWAKRTDNNVVQMKKIFPILDAIRSTAEERGARYVIVIHPDQFQVDDKLREDVVATSEVDEQEYDLDLPQEILLSYCVDRAIACLDLLPILHAQAKHADLYLFRDAHYDHTGNELTATTIRQFLQDRQLLPSFTRSMPLPMQSRQ